MRFIQTLIAMVTILILIMIFSLMFFDDFNPEPQSYLESDIVDFEVTP